MSEYYLGWGSRGWGDYPSEFPLTTSSSASMEDYGGTFMYGIVPDGEVPPGVVVEMTLTLYPADGSESRSVQLQGPMHWDDPQMHFREHNWEIHPGIYEITAFANGVSCANKLMLVVMDTGGAYATISYYAEGNAPEVPAFWTAFQGAREIR